VPEERIPDLIDRLCHIQSSDLRVIQATVQEFMDADLPSDLFHAWTQVDDFQGQLHSCFRFEKYDSIIDALKKEVS
jgi:hypothetical protein